ncbi:hypothetical protein Tco_0290504 [Tanacetum coccineum]
MEQYLTNTDYSLWQVILNGDGPIQVTTNENGIETEVPPKTDQALLQRQRERKAKSILLLAIPDEYQLRFHGIKDAKSLWAAINLLEVHGAAVPNEDANQNFLRALPSSWNNVALIIRNKDGIDDFDIDDLYNNLKVFEANIKGSFGSSSNSHNVAFLSIEDTSSSNEVNTANGVSTASSNSPQLDDEYLEQIDHDDLEEMDLKLVEEQQQDRANVMQLLKWKLHENCGVHTLFMMLEAEEESTMAFELIKFIKSMLEE